MPILVDTNVLIDIAYDDPDWRDWSQGQLERHAGELVINPVIFAEFSYRYRDMEAVDAALDPAEFLREHIPWEAAFAAGQAFHVYRLRGGGRSLYARRDAVAQSLTQKSRRPVAPLTGPS